MEVRDQSAVAPKRPPLTPKALIHQKYGVKACFKTEEVQQMVDSGCPGLVISQARCMYRCCLDLPELSVTSDSFLRKKDAEQAAAKIAVEKLGIQTASTDSIPDEAPRELVARITSLFTDEFLSSSHPLVNHIRVALKKVDGNELIARVPASIIASYDTKINGLCKIINPEVESDPLLAVSCVLRSARNSESVLTIDGELWISKRGSYSQDVLQSLQSFSGRDTPCAHISAVYIPCSIKESVRSSTLDVSDNYYYMDDIAQALGARDNSRVLISRTVGKASSETKLFFSCPEDSDLMIKMLSCAEVTAKLGSVLNVRASYLSGQNIYGDAILANVGYTWKSSDLYFEDVPLCSYYRMLLSKLPDGYYKLSSGALLVAKLPTTYISKSSWRGPSPKDALSAFCRQHRLSEPVFSVNLINSYGASSESLDVCENAGTKGEDVGFKSCSYECSTKILSRGNQPVIECTFGDAYNKEANAIQNAALRVLSWFRDYFEQLDMPVEELCSFGRACNIDVHLDQFRQAFAKCLELYNVTHGPSKVKHHGSLHQPIRKRKNETIDLNNEDLDYEFFKSPGTIACISYSVVLLNKNASLKETLESQDEFEFEIGAGSVIDHLEECVARLSINQHERFVVDLPSKDLILAAAGESVVKILQCLSFEDCVLEYSVRLLHVSEPLEERMEQALFSPSLSKQRVEFAVRYINSSHAATLVDFGCGSGSLLDSLLDHPTTLEKIVGVDISPKGLARAAKMLHTKLSTKTGQQTRVRSAVLCDGSITEFDSRFLEPDIGTCLEVIEHMEEDQADLFGHVVLTSFRPHVLIVSTPNYEYNPLLQKSSSTAASAASNEDEKCCRFRNHDHKFEWTREQFQRWATNLASKHTYTVEFSGVGGSGDTDPGFASQMAVFMSSGSGRPTNSPVPDEGPSPRPYKVIWEWNSSC